MSDRRQIFGTVVHVSWVPVKCRACHVRQNDLTILERNPLAELTFSLKDKNVLSHQEGVAPCVSPCTMADDPISKSQTTLSRLQRQICQICR